MPKPRILRFATFVLAVACSVYQAQPGLDSLKTLLSKSADDTLKCAVLESLSDIADDGEWQQYNEQMGALSRSLSASKNPAVAKRAVRYYGTYLNNKGYDFTTKGDCSKGIEYYQQALDLYNKAGVQDEKALVLSSMGAIYDRLGETDEALKHYREALAIQEHSTVYKDQIATLCNLAVIYGKKGDEKRRYESYARCLEIAKAHPLKNHALTSAYAGIAQHYLRTGDYRNAMKYFRTGLALAEEIVDKPGMSSNLEGIADIYLLTGNPREALGYAERALKAAREVNHPYEVNNAAATLAKVYERLGRYRESLETVRIANQSRELLRKEQDQRTVLHHKYQSEFEKKELQSRSEQERKDAISRETMQKARIVRNGLTAGFAIAILFASILLVQRVKIRKANRAMREAKERAEQSERAEQQFLANMSHEIRTPMNAVIGMAALLLESPLQARQQYYLECIRNAGDTLLHIINDILDLSKIEAGKMDIEQIDFSIADVVEQVRQTISHRAEEKGLELLVDIDPLIPPVVLGDPVRFNQVLMNLAGNAIKFTEQGSVTIKVKPGKQHGTVEFAVTDTGIGIPPEKLETVFDNFKQANTSDTRKYGGTGLGLSISRQLVELMGGKITIESAVGIGTTFRFTMPFETGSAERLAERSMHEKDIDGSILDHLAILVVDDNEYNRVVAADTITSRSKAFVMSVGSAEEGIAALSKNDYDIVLMDVQMPQMNGYEATRHIRKNIDVPGRRLPVVGLTASVQRSDLEKCIEAGMDGYIPKPFKPSQLIGGIAQAMKIPMRRRSSAPASAVTIEVTVEEVTNLKYLHGFCNGETGRMKKYVAMFTDSAPVLIEGLKKSVAMKDRVAIADQVHAFKMRWVMMGMDTAKDLALRIESNCRQERELDTIAPDVNVLIACVEKAIQELEPQLKPQHP